MNEIRKMLRTVVSDGTGQNAEINGWDIAGKTGTAQKFKNGSYSNDQFISNFIGFFPFKNPQLLAFVMLDEPESPYHWGAEGAAVAFNRIIKRIIRMDDNIKPPTRTLEDFIETKDISEITETIDNIKKHQKISKRIPSYLSTKGTVSYKIKMPKLKGYSMKKALTKLNESKLKVKISGSGAVIWQNPKPGELVFQGSTCSIGLQ